MPGAIAERIAEVAAGAERRVAAVFAVFGRPREGEEGRRRQTAGSAPRLDEFLRWFGCLFRGARVLDSSQSSWRCLQHLTLLVGHPIFTLSVLLFTLLAFGGIGAALSPRWPMWKACVAVAIIGTIEALALPKLVPALLWLPLWGRIAVAIVLIAPLGSSDGHAFPAWAETDWRRASAGAAVLLGTERHHVGDRVSDDGVRGLAMGIPGGDVDGQRVLCAGGVGVDEGIS